MSRASQAAAGGGVAGFLETICGPLVEFGEWGRDVIRRKRFKTQIRTLQMAKEMLDNAGLSATTVPTKILVPLLEAASLEDDGMEERWAALLANAAAGVAATPVRPSFVAILRDLAADEAALVNWLYDASNDPPVPRADHQGGVIIENVDEIRESLALNRVAFDVVVENIVRLGLAARPLENGPPRWNVPADLLSSRGSLSRTSLGQAFVSACTRP